jgi:hypothetical protein
MHAAADVSGSDRFTFRSQGTASNNERSYTRSSAGLRDTIDVRVFRGIHFRSADVQGARLGKPRAAPIPTADHGCGSGAGSTACRRDRTRVVQA